MLLEVEELHAFYGTSHVLQGISLGVKQGEIVGLLGRNGMGKSTTLKALMGLLRPRSGSIRFDGKDIFGHPPHRVARSGIAYVPEERRIFPTLTVMENLSIAVGPARGEQMEGSRWSVETVLDWLPPLKERLSSKGAHLSGGEAQMLAIGRALMGQPKLLLVDEPTEGLSPLMAKQVREMLAMINRQGVAVLLVDHNYESVLSLAQRVCVMGKGRIGFIGTADEMRGRPDIREKFLEV